MSIYHFLLYNGKSCKALIEVVSELGFMTNGSRLTPDKLYAVSIPIILCSSPKRVFRWLEEGHYQQINLNLEIAKGLLVLPKVERISKINKVITDIISRFAGPIYIENYEILFDPRYEIDVIKVFIEIARRQKVVVKWCGRLNGDSLEYATPDDRDYHSFRIQDYDITCVI